MFAVGRGTAWEVERRCTNCRRGMRLVGLEEYVFERAVNNVDGI